MKSVTHLVSPWADGKRTTIMLCPKVQKLFVAVEDFYGRNLNRMAFHLPNDFSKVCDELCLNSDKMGWTKSEEVA